MIQYALIQNNKCIELKYFDTKPELPLTKPQWVEVIEDDYPPVSENQIVEKHEELITRKWVISYTVRAKNDYELWHDKDSLMRIKISLNAITVNAQLQGFVSQLILWWSLMKFNYETESGFAYFYCNQILPAHQSIVDSFMGLIEIETIPTA